MLQFTAHPRSSRVVNADELARYQASATYRRAKMRAMAPHAWAALVTLIIVAGVVVARIMGAH
jgi:hypothetical protein